jgi:hypothetical protein
MRRVRVLLLVWALSLVGCEEGTCSNECEDQRDECLENAKTDEAMRDCERVAERCFGVCASRERFDYAAGAGAD